MNTKPWSAPAEGAVMAAGFNAAAQFDVIDKAKTSSLGLCGALYVVIASLRLKMPVQVMLDGEELFSFDGDEVQQTPQFGTLLAEFEYCLLSERRKGSEETLARLEQRVAENEAAQRQRVAAGTQQQQPSTDSVQHVKSGERDDRRRGGPGGRRR